jgi:hypothetical protein
MLVAMGDGSKVPSEDNCEEMTKHMLMTRDYFGKLKTLMQTVCLSLYIYVSISVCLSAFISAGLFVCD